MNCEQFREMIGAFTLGDLPPEETEQVARHLAECAACRQYADSIGRTVEALEADTDRETYAAEAAVHEAETLAHVRDKVAGRGTKNRFVYVALRLAAAIVLFVGGYVARDIQSHEPSEPTATLDQLPKEWRDRLEQSGVRSYNRLSPLGLRVLAKGAKNLRVPEMIKGAGGE